MKYLFGSLYKSILLRKNFTLSNAQCSRSSIEVSVMYPSVTLKKLYKENAGTTVTVKNRNNGIFFVTV